MTADNARTARLRRLDRYFTDTPIYFVTACTANRRSILANEQVHRVLNAFAISGESHGAFVGRYVIMPDHVHVFIGLDDQKISLSMWMKSLKNAISKILRTKKIASPHWQKGFFDHVLRSDESHEEKWHYVRENPVRAGLVQHWNQWPYAGEINDLRLD